VADRHPSSAVVRDEWRRRTIAEYRSAAITTQLTLWMIQAGLSPDLLRDGLRIVDDELEHAHLSHQVLLDAGGGETAVELDRATLALPEPPAAAFEDRLLLTVVRVFCLGETIAVPLFRLLRADCTVPSARRALDRILVDEARHRAFGWDVLDVLVDQRGPEATGAVVEPRLAAMLRELDESYGRGALERDHGGITDADRAWGVVPPGEYAAAFEATLDAVWVPRFADLGIAVHPDWRHPPSPGHDC
jgi:hypothetical protein